MKAQREKIKKENPTKKSFAEERKKKFISSLKKLAEALCEAEGMELVHIEYQREPRGRILRIYIDRPGGVTLDDCAYISRKLSDIIDEDNLDAGLGSNRVYNLEVSSPGLERPLAKKSDFERFKGRTARIKTCFPVNGQKKFKGILLGTSKEVIKLLIDDKTVTIPFQDVSSARLVY